MKGGPSVFIKNGPNKLPRMSRRIDTVKVGEVMRSVGNVFDENKVHRFAELSGDLNPIHFSNTGGKPIVHGMLCAGLIPALFSKNFPGCVYASQNLNFKKPVFLDMPVYAEIRVAKIRLMKSHYFLKCETYVRFENDSMECINGMASVLVPIE